MEQDLRSLFDVDAFSATERLPNLNILDATPPSFKVRTGSLSDITPASILQMVPSCHHDSDNQANANAAHDVGFLSQLRHCNDQGGSQQRAARSTLDQHFALSSGYQHALVQTGFVQDELEVRTAHRVREEPQIGGFRSMSSDFRAEQQPKNLIVNGDEIQTIREGEITKKSIRKDREMQSGKIIDYSVTPCAGVTVQSTTKAALTGKRAATDLITEENLNGSTFPCVPETNIGLRRSSGGSLSQPLQTTSPFHHTGNLFQYNAALQLMQDTDKFPPHSGIASHIPVLSIDKSQRVGRNFPATARAEMQTDLRASREVMMKAHIAGNVCSPAPHLLNLHAGFDELVHDLVMPRYAHDGEAPKLEISHMQGNVHVGSGVLPYDAPITDFEISHGGFGGKVDTSYDANKPSNAHMDITYQDALSHLSEADLLTTSRHKKTRGRPEIDAGNGASLSRWRQKRRRTNDIASLCGKEDESKAEQMKLQRAMRNRESAKRSRVKSKVQFQNMERKYAELTDENMALTTLIGTLLPPCIDLIPKDAKEALELATNPAP